MGYPLLDTTPGTRMLLLHLACLLLASCVRPLPPTMRPAEVARVRTADGWTLPLRHYPGDGPPVLLVHGMAANHYNWDYRPEVSLADFLQGRGWDVWIPALRGDQGSVAPSRRAAADFGFDDYARLDLPPVLDTVLAATGRRRLYWVGHSMGGMLLYTTLKLVPERVAAGVVICSPAGFHHLPALQRRLRHTRWLAAGRGLEPNRAAARLLMLFGGRPLVGVIANPSDMDPALAAGLARNAIVDLPRAIHREVVDWLRSGELRDLQGRPWMVPATLPLLALGSAGDRVAPWRDVRAACETIHPCTFRLLGRSTGFSVDFGHADTVLGLHSRDEVFPLVADYLDRVSAREHDAHPPGASRPGPGRPAGRGGGG